MIHQKARRQWVEQRDENIEICCGIIFMKLWDWFRHYICHFIGVKYLCNFLHSLQQRLYELPCSSGVNFRKKINNMILEQEKFGVLKFRYLTFWVNTLGIDLECSRRGYAANLPEPAASGLIQLHTNSPYFGGFQSSYVEPVIAGHCSRSGWYFWIVWPDNFKINFWLILSGLRS